MATRGWSSLTHYPSTGPSALASVDAFHVKDPVEKSMPSLLIESVHLYAVPRQAAGLREGLTAGGARVGAVAGMGAHVCRQIVGPRAGLASDGALEDELAACPIPPPLARPSRAPTPAFTRRSVPCPLAADHRDITRFNLAA